MRFSMTDIFLPCVIKHIRMNVHNEAFLELQSNLKKKPQQNLIKTNTS